MLIIGCDFHSRFQQVAMVDTDTGELIKRRLEHANGEAKKFYAELDKPVRVGMEATGYAQWFERMLAKLGHELARRSLSRVSDERPTGALDSLRRASGEVLLFFA
jgi:transposase